MGFCNVLSVATTLNDERVLNTVARITHDLNALSLAKYAANVASNGALDAPIIYGLHCLPLTDRAHLLPSRLAHSFLPSISLRGHNFWYEQPCWISLLQIRTHVAWSHP